MANQLLEVRENIYYSKKETEGEYNKFHELIFVTDEAKYSRTNEGDVVRERGCKEFKIVVTSENLGKLIEVLQSYKDAKEEDLR